MRFCAQIQQGVGDLLDTCRELVPRDALPLQTAKIAKCDGWFCAVLLGHFVDENGKMTIQLHSVFLITMQKYHILTEFENYWETILSWTAKKRLS